MVNKIVIRDGTKLKMFSIYDVKTRNQLQIFINMHPNIINELEECMTNDLLRIGIKSKWTIDNWLNPTNPLYKNANYYIIIRNGGYVGSFRYIMKLTANIYDNVKVNRDNYIYIGVVLVNPLFRRKGLCYSMLSRFINDKDKRVVLRVSRKNRSAIRCYKKVGFIRLSNKIIDDNIIFIY
jgi:predicted GNAT family N-acyltransferase